MYMYIDNLYEAHHSCRLKEFSEWAQCQILDLLLRYHPATEDEVFDMLVRGGE